MLILKYFLVVGAALTLGLIALNAHLLPDGSQKYHSGEISAVDRCRLKASALACLIAAVRPHGRGECSCERAPAVRSPTAGASLSPPQLALIFRPETAPVAPKAMRRASITGRPQGRVIRSLSGPR